MNGECTCVRSRLIIHLYMGCRQRQSCKMASPLILIAKSVSLSWYQTPYPYIKILILIMITKSLSLYIYWSWAQRLSNVDCKNSLYLTIYLYIEYVANFLLCVQCITPRGDIFASWALVEHAARYQCENTCVARHS